MSRISTQGCPSRRQVRSTKARRARFNRWVERRRVQSQGMRPWSGMENLEPRLLMSGAPLTVNFALADQRTNQALSTLNLTTSEPVVGSAVDGAGSTSVYSLLHLGFDQVIGGGDDTNIPITTANYDGNTSISLGLSSTLADGKYRLLVQSGNPGLRTSADGTALDGDNDGNGGDPFGAVFTVDRTPPQVASIVPSITAGVTSDALVQFTEEMNAASVNASNISVDTPGGATPVTGIVYEGSNIFRIQFAPQSAPGDYHVNIHDVTDLAGNKLAVEQPGTVIYQNNFENPLTVGAEWSNPVTVDEDVTTRYLGMFQNNDVTLSLNSLPVHSKIKIDFDLYLRDTWDGNELGDGDKFGFGVDSIGTADTYSNFDFLPQSFSGSPDVGRFNFFGDPLANDSIYRRMTGTVEHTGSTASLFFFGANLNDENWGIDNLKVTLFPDPAVQPEATFTHTFTIDTQPPTVDSVVWGSNYIRVKFNDNTDMDKLSAEDFANYQVRASGGDRFFEDGFALSGSTFYFDGFNGFAPDQIIGPWDIDYQSETKTATLYFLNPLADEAYELRVFGDIVDLAGNGLGGGNVVSGHLVDNDNPPIVNVDMESLNDTGVQGDLRTQNRSPFFNLTADQAGRFDIQVTRLGFDTPFFWFSDTFILTEANGTTSFRIGDPGNTSSGGGAAEAQSLDFFTLDDGKYQVRINYYGTNSDSDYTEKVFEFTIDNQSPALIPSQSGVAGKALEFDGIDGFDPAIGGDVATIPTNNYFNGWNQIYNNQQITIESWVRVDSYPQGNFSVVDYGQWLLQLSSTGDLQFIVGGNAFTPGQPVNLPVGEWHHVAVSYETYHYSPAYGYSSRATFYIDGQQVGQSDEKPYTTYLNYTGQPVYLGFNPFGAAEYSHGALDELRIWSKVRTQADILADINSAIPADSAGLVGLWHFEETPGSTTILDSSGNNNHGTISDGRQIAGRSYNDFHNVLLSPVSQWTLTFNEVLNAASVQASDFQLLDPTMSDISASIQSVQVQGSFVTLHFNAPLAAVGQYTVVVNGPLADAAGNQTSPASVDHFSIVDFDDQSPIVVDLEPQGETTPVGSIFVEFGEDVDITVGDITLLMPDASPYAGTITITQVPGRGRYRLDLDGPLTAAGTYTITIAGAVADSSGNELDGNGDGVAGDAYTATFSIDNSAPALVTGFFLNNSTIQVQFSEVGSGIDPSTFSNLYAAFTLTGSGGDGILGGGLANDQTLFVFSNFEWNAGANTLTIFLTNNLPDDAYNLAINPVIRDFAGNAIAPSGFSTSFDFVNANDLFLGLNSESDTGVFTDDGLTNDNTPTLLVRPAFNAGRIHVDLEGDGFEDVSTFTSFGNAGGNFLFDLPAALPDGEHHFTVTFEAADTGETIVKTYFYTIDTQPPVLDPVVLTDVQSLTLTISDNSDLFDVNSIVNSGNYTLLASGGDGIFGNGNDQNISGTISSVEFDDVTGEIVIHTNTPILEDKIRLIVNGNLSDAAGNRLNSGNNTVLEFDNLNASPIIYPNLTGKLPVGSLIYDPFVNSTFFGAGDVDDFTISVDPGQKLTVGLVPLNSGIEASLELFDGSMNSLGFVSANAAGQSVILQNLPTTGGTQTYTLRATSIVGNGAYELHVVLNAMVDSEDIGPADNDSIALAEDLEATSLALTGAADRLGAIGTLQGTDVDFYKFTAHAGQFNDIAVTSQSNQVISLAVFNSSGTLIALGSPRENISGFIQGLISSADQELYIRVSGDPDSDYTLVVTRNATLDAESNTALATPQSLGGPLVALGGLGFSDKITDFTDDIGNASLEGWTINGGLWHVTSAVGGTLLGDQHSAPHIAYYGLDATGNFNAGATAGNLISPVVVLPAAGNPTLDFKYRLAGEGGNPYDRASVMISVDGGGFTEIATNANGTIPQGTGSWLFKSINLSSFAGHNVQFMFRFNTVDSIANSSLGWQVDDIHVTGPDADYYFFNASEGANLQITTQTPGDGPGQPLNELNPMIELFGPGGASVASDQNGAADGRNAVINYAVPVGAAGVYTVVVRSESGVGDYILKVDGADTTIGPAPSVVSTAPVNGAVIGSLSPFIDVTFSEAIRGDSLDLSDLQITSGSATVTGVSLLKSDTVRFTLSGPPGDQTVNYTITAGSILDLQNQGNAAYSGNLIIDNTGARVVSTSPTSVNSAFDHIDVTFSEPIQGSTLTNANIVLRDPANNVVSITSVTNVSGNTWRLNFVTQNAIGVHSLKIGPGVLDAVDNPMDQDQDGINNEAVEDVFNASIVLGDQVPLQVVGVAPQLTNGNVSAITVTFNDVVDQSTFDLGDVSITAQNPAPTSWYQFEEGSGTSFFDQQEGASDGTHNAGYSADVPLASVGGHANTRSLSFNGTQSAVSSENFLFHTATDATLEFFIKAPNQPHDSVFWTRTDGTDTNRYNIGFNPGGAMFVDYRSPDGSLHSLGGFNLAVDVWNHVAIVRTVDSAHIHTYRYYVNGQQVGSAVDVNPNLPTSSGWSIAERPGFRFNGLLDEIRLTDKALIPSQFLPNVPAAPPAPTSFSWDASGKVLTLNFASPISAEGKYKLSIGPNILDDEGNSLSPGFTSFPAASGSNLIQNGGFDSYDAGGSFESHTSAPAGFVWTIGNNNVDIINSLWQGASGSTNPDGFDQSVDIDNNAFIQQSFATVPGQAYRLQFDYAHNPFNIGSIGSVTVTGATTRLNQSLEHRFISDQNAMNYSHFDAVFIADSLSTTLRFQGDFANGFAGFVVDNVRVQSLIAPDATAYTADVVIDKTAPVASINTFNGSQYFVFLGDNVGMNVSTIQNIANYTLVNSGGDGIFGNGNDVSFNANLVRVQWDPATGLAHVIYNVFLPDDIYRFTVKGAVSDLAGNSLAGGDLVFTHTVNNGGAFTVIDLDSPSDTGFDNTDNKTADTTPTFSIYASEAGTLEVDLNGDNIFETSVLINSSIAGYQSFTAPALADGNYTIHSRLTPTSGPVSNASLDITIDTHGASITSSVPNGPVDPPVDHINVTFSEAIDPSSFTVADVTLLSPSSTPITIDSIVNVTGNIYRLNFAAQTTNGIYTLNIGPNIADAAGSLLNQDGDGVNGEAGQDGFSSTFTISDLTPPQVQSITPTGPVNSDVSSVVIVFTEKVDVTTFDLSDIVFTTPGGIVSPTSLTANDATVVGGKTGAQTWTLSFANQSVEGDYSVAIGPNILDLAGLQFQVSSQQLIYQNDFEGGAGGEWSSLTLAALTPPDTGVATNILGRYTNDTVTLTLAAVPAHSTLTVMVDLYILDSWDDGGLAGGDIWQYTVTGADINPVFKHTFSNFNVNSDTFPGTPDVGPVHFAFTSWPDAIYRNLQSTINHIGSSVQIAFSGANLQDVNDESWAIDNVRIFASVDTAGQAFLGKFTIDKTAPTVTTVSANQNQIQITYADAVGMNVASVVDKSNYILKASGGDGVFGDANDIDVSSRIQSIFFNPATGVATLTLSPALNDDVFQLTINGTASVKDAAGNKIDGDANGSAGGDKVSTFLISFNTPSLSIDLEAGSDTGASSVDDKTADNTPSFTVNFNESGLLELDLDGNGIYETSQFVPGSGNLSFTSLTLSDGAHTIAARLTTTSGQIVNASQALIIDTAGPSITLMNPSGPIDPPVDHVIVDFNEAIDPATFTTSDVTLTGPDSKPITVISIVQLTASQYRINFTAQTNNGVYAVAIGPGVRDAAGNDMNQDGDGVNGEAGQDAFNGSFTIADLTAPQVLSITPTGPTNQDVSQVTIVFTEKVDVTTFDLSDIVFTTPGGIVSPTSLTANDATVVGAKTGATTWTLGFATQSVEGNYTLAIGPNILDLAGLQMIASPQQTVYQTDFESGVGAEWSSSTLSVVTLPDATSSHVIGQFNNGTVTLSLGSVPAHSQLTVLFDLYILDSWDGGSLPGGDRWSMAISGALPNPAFQHTFSNFSPNGGDSFPGLPDVGPVNFALASFWPDALYRNLSATLSHIDSTVQISFSGANLEDITNESWALDNVRVIATVDTAGQAFLGKFTIDKTAPTVANAVISPSQIQVTYADAVGMDVVSILDKSNYTLKASGGDGLFGNGNDIDVSSRIQSILFNPATGVATLALSPSLGDDIYQLTINGTNSVKDAAGNKIAGGDFVSTLTLNALAASVSIDLQSNSDSGQNNGDNITQNTNLDFTVNFNESGLLELDFDGDNIFESLQVVSGSGSLNFNRTLPEGTTTLHARLTPTAGAAANASLPVTVDIHSPNVTATVPANGGSVFGVVNFIDVVFNEDINFNTILLIGGVNISGPSGFLTPTGLSAVNGHTARVFFNPLTEVGNYTITVGNSVQDVAGNNLDQDGTAGSNNTFSASFQYRKADLTVTAGSLAQNAAFFGEGVFANWTVQNIDPGAIATGTWNDTFFLSTDNVLDAGDFQLNSVPATAFSPLGPGSSYATGSTVIAPVDPSLADGSYFILIKTDGGNAVVENDETNNSRSLGQITLTTKPGPAVVSMDPGLGSVFNGELNHIDLTFDTAINASTYNNSDFTVTGPDGAIVVTGFQAISANTVRVFFNTQTKNGAYTITAGPDIKDMLGNKMDQDDDGINGEAVQDVFTGSFTIGLPDLTVDSVTPASFSAVFNNTLQVSWVVHNIGTRDTTGPWSDRLWLSADTALGAGDVQLKTVPATLTPLVAGSGTYLATTTVTLPLNPSFLAGNYFVLVQTDPFAQLLESNEANNVTASAAVNIALPPLPDLTVSAIEQVVEADTDPNTPGNQPGAKIASAGSQITVKWTTSNNGGTNITNGQWSESIYLSTDGAIGGDILLGTFNFTTSLAVGGSVIRQQTVTLPTTIDGNVKFVVKVDSNSTIFESNENNNENISADSTLVPHSLTLTLPAAVAEGLLNQVGTITRSGSTATPLTVHLATFVGVTLDGDGNFVPNPDATELAFPAIVVIPAGQNSVNFNFNSLNDSIIDGTQAVFVEARADFDDNDVNNPGSVLTNDYQTVNVTDIDKPTVQLTVDDLTLAEGESTTGHVTLNFTPLIDISVSLLMDTPMQLFMPPTVTILAGTTSADFAITAIQDSVLEQPVKPVTLFAQATGFNSSSKVFSITDDDTDSLQFTVIPSAFSEGAGATAATGTIKRLGNLDNSLTINLYSSDPTEATVPQKVVIPAGSSTVTFTIAAIDDFVLDGDQPVVLTARFTDPFTLQELTAGQTTANIVVTDNDGPTLTITLDRDLMGESGTATGKIRRTNGDNSLPLIIALQSSDVGEATVPPTVTINANESEATFTVTGIDDGIIDFSQPVTILGTAAGYASGAAGITITDTLLPDLRAVEITVDPASFTNSTFHGSYKIFNQGIVSASGAWNERIFLSTDDVFDATKDLLVGQVGFNGSVAAGSFYGRTITINTPSALGNYRLFVQVDPSNSLTEVLENNNVGSSAGKIQINPAYSATITATPEQAIAGSPITFSGIATRSDNAQPAQFEAVAIHILHNGTVRTIAAITNQFGQFTTQFNPLNGEGGDYSVRAGHPSVAVGDLVDQDTFKIIGMTADPGFKQNTIIVGTPTSGSFTVSNLSNVALTGLTYQLLDVPGNLTIDVTAPSTLAGNGSITVNYTINAADASVTSQLSRIRIHSAEGATLDLGLGDIVKPLAPHLVTSGAVKGGMVRGQQATWSVTITNDGGLETGDLQIQLPGAFPWLSVAGSTTIPSIAAGQSYTFQLLTSPPSNLPLGPYNGNIVISNPSIGASVPIQFNCVSEAKGDVLITTVDEKTFYGEGNPNLAGAHVVIRDAFFGSVVAEGVTGADGNLLLSNLAEGVYNIEIDAIKHDGYRNVVQIIPGQTAEVLAFLRTQLVTYNWVVEPILIEDRYNISLETVFTTTVPTPVVTIDPGLIDLSTIVGDETTINLTITNHGLISATDLKLSFPTDPDWEFTPLVTNLGDLAAKSTMVVPVLIRRLNAGGASASGASYNTNTLAGSGVSNLAGALGASGGSGGPCSLQAGLVWTLVCGPFGVNYPVPIPIINVRGNCGGTPSGSGGGGGGLGWGGWGGGGGPGGGGGGFGDPAGGGPTGIYYSPPPDCSCGPDFVPTTYKGEVGLSVSKALDPLKAAINKILGKLVLPPPFSLQLTDLVFKGSISGELTTCCENGQKGLKAKGQVQGGVEAVIRLGISGGLPGFTLSDGTAVECEGFAGIELKLAGNVSATLETDCFFRNPKLTVAGNISGDLSLMAEVKGKAALPGVGTGEVSGKIGVKGSLSAAVQASTGGGSHVTASAGPIVFFAGLEGSVENEITHVKTTVGGEYSRELAPQVTIPDAGGSSFEGFSADAGLSGDPTAGDIAAMFGYDSVTQLLVDCGCDTHDGQLFNNVTNQSTAKTLSDAIAAANKSSFVVVDAKPNTFNTHVMSDVEAENRRLQSQNLANGGASGLAGDDGTCAQVRILIEQEAVLTRRAAGATLEITNNDDTNPVTDIIVNPIIYDADGNVANDKFVLLPVVVTNMASHPGTPPAGWDEEVDGPYFTVDSFSLGAGQSGRVRFIFLPKDDAVPIGQASAVYRFGGTLTYTVGGVTTSNTLQPGTITVFPDAKLDLRYFLQRDVFSDDPFTDIQEPSIPFSLGVMVNNKGRGTAQNFKITSAQPKIIENEKGLLIDFQIIAAQVDGQNLTPSLEVNFGDIAPGETDVAQWLMKATLQGHFIEYKASFTHTDSLGGKAASLLDKIEIHETTHVVEAGGVFDDGRHDFLTNDLFDEEYLPDHLYLSDFSIADVAAQDAVRGSAIITVGPQITTSHLQTTVQATLVDGWNYLRFLDPGHGQFKLISVQRSDGLFINLDENAWQTDRTFKEVDKRPIDEDVMHILDYNAPSAGAGGSDITPYTYTLNFAPIDSDAPQITVLDEPVSPVFNAIPTLDITFSEQIDLSTFTESDITLTRNGGPNLIAANPGAVTITHLSGATYRINGLSALTADDGAYSLTVNATGINDLFGNAGVGSKSSNWSKAQFAPVVESIFGAPSAQTNQPAGDVFVKFSESINLGSFDFNDLSLKRNGGANLINNSVQITQVDSVTYRIQGLGPLTGLQGNYVLSVNATGIEDLEGTSGVGSASVAWSVDTTPPALNNVVGAPPAVTASDPGDLFFNFSEQLDPSSFTLSDITLTLNGGGNIVNNTVTLQNVNGSQFKLSNLAGLTTADGNYVLTLNVAGVSDLAGNSGIGATVINWTKDSQAPAAAANLAISPDTGVSNTDGITKTLTVTIGGQLGESGLSLFFKDVLHNVDLGSMQVAGTTFARQVTLPVSGSQTVQIRAVDQAGNETSTTIDFFVDVQPPVVNGFIGVPTSPTTQPVVSIDIVLSEAPVAGTFTKSNITLTRDNIALDLSSATLVQVPGNPLRFTLGNLAALTGDLGAYALTVNMTGVQDTAGNEGSTSTTANWTLAITNADPNVFLTTTDYEVFEGETFFLNGFVIDDNGPWSGTVDFGCGCGIKTLIFSNADFSQTKIFRDNKPGDAAYLGVATILDSLGGTSNANFQVVVHNAAPVIVTFTADDLAGDIGQTFHFLGKATDAGNTSAYTTDPLTYTFDFGDGQSLVVTNNTPGQEVDFTAAASHVYTAAGHYLVKMTVDDGDGGVVFTTAAIDVAAPASIANRAVFYNNSLFDGNGSALGAADDNAIAVDKQALIAGQASFANYTSYSRGINGIIVDINGLSGTPDASDFVFRVGNDSDPNGAGWSTLAVAPTILVRHGAGVGGSDRVMIGLPDNAVQKQWLQITVKASLHTGLGADDVFYFGNAIGETGDNPANAIVDSLDESGAATHPRRASNLAPVDFAFDFNRDGLVNAADQVIARVNKTTAQTALQLINAPAPVQPQAPLGEASGSSLDSNPLFSPADIDLLTGSLNVDKKKLAVSNTWYNLLKKSAPLTENNGIVNLL